MMCPQGTTSSSNNLQLQRLAGDRAERIHDRVENLLVFATPDLDFAAVGQQPQADVFRLAAGNQKSQRVVRPSGELRGTRAAQGRVSLAGMKAGQETPAGVVV